MSQQLHKIVAFVNSHDDKPQPAEIVGDKVRVYSLLWNSDTKEEKISVDDVSTMAQARKLLGY